MSQVLSVNLPAQPVRAVYRDCLAALLHPSLSTYSLLGQQRAGVWRAYLLIFASSVIASLIGSLAALGAQLEAQRSLDTLLLALIPVTALIATCSLATFGWCAYQIARSLKGSGTYAQLAYVLAAIGAPLSVVASIMDQIPVARIGLIALYLYWLAQYGLAIRAVSGLPRLRAITAMLLTLLLLGIGWLGIAFLVGYTGILMP
jgi:hypothetical protein